MNQSSVWIFILFIIFCLAFALYNSQKKKKRNMKFSTGQKTLNTSGVILKYELEPNMRSALMLPASAEIITIKGIGDSVYIWAIVPENQINVKRIFNVIPTGGSVPENTTYIGTAYPENHVFHIFEENQ
ncbi:DUF7352 domain-containing protein [Escherichia coli]|uniref:DUF7352 domain-containing protein n=1 Tax=Escherichia coli TaxID=562 RepID=UPI0012EFD58A|nr:hypothetical protein [Salmonella enterica subsp. enterica serovar Telelkebir]HCJ0630423.1 hypothetical protein [Salmonella enterica subsp. enterica serovar Infantis]